MGKGDKKSRRGKLFQGSYGVRRPRKKTGTAAEVSKPVSASVKEPAPKPAPEPKTAKPAPVKKEVKPKKTEEAGGKHE